MSGGLEIIRGACAHDCPDTCARLVEVENGIARKLVGDPGHPFTRGVLCAKVNYYLERVYDRNRNLYPLKRVGAKGDAKFVQVSWDDALAGISRRWKSIIQESGAEAILPYSFAGNQGLIQCGSLDRRLFATLGASRLERGLCGETAVAGLAATQGSGLGIDPEDIVHSRYIVLWEPTRLSRICTFGPTSAKRGRTARGSWSSIRSEREPRTRRIGTSVRCPRPTPRWRSG